MVKSYLMDKSNTFIFTQARLASQRLPRKMLLPFGSPANSLWNIACEKLDQIQLPRERKWVSVYESSLEDVAENYDVSVYWRSYQSAHSDNGVAEIWEICSAVDFDYYVMFNPCLPMLSVETIQDFLDYFMAIPEESLFGVVPVRDYFWGEDGNLRFPTGVSLLNTKEAPLLYKAAHALYAGRVSDIRKNVQLGDFTKDNPSLYVMKNKVELLDVDDAEDFKIAEAVWKATLKA